MHRWDLLAVGTGRYAGGGSAPHSSAWVIRRYSLTVEGHAVARCDADGRPPFDSVWALVRFF